MFFELAVENHFTDILEGNEVGKEISEEDGISLPPFEEVDFNAKVFDPFDIGGS